MALSPALVGLILALSALVLLPTRRLYLAGWPASWLTAYYLAMLLLGLLVAELRGPTRFLVPILVVVYLAPFVTVHEGLARLLGPPRNGPAQPKDVTPRGDDRRES